MNETTAPSSGPVFDSQITTSTKEFALNREAMLSIVKEWRTRIAKVKEGGGREAVDRHKSRGKLTARERIEALIDKGTREQGVTRISATALADNAASIRVMEKCGLTLEGRFLYKGIPAVKYLLLVHICFAG